MRISFFEEYPTESSLAKLRVIPFRTNLYIVCRNVDEFLKMKARLKKEFRNINRVVYWPILHRSEGYWISAFSKTSAIKRILAELGKAKGNFPVLWDAEVPTFNKKLFFSELPKVLLNRRLIQEAIRNQSENHPFIVAEWPRYGLSRLMADLAGISFPFSGYQRLDMLYTSLLRMQNKGDYIRRVIRDSRKKFKRYSVGLGLIGRGEEDYTIPLISYADLDRDLNIVQAEGVSETVIYRLGGLNKAYLGVIKKYTEL